MPPKRSKSPKRSTTPKKVLEPPQPENLMERAAKGASLLAMVVFGQRLVTFALNAFVVASVDPELLGFAAGTMEVLLATLLFVSREPFRLAAMRSGEVLDVSWMGYGGMGCGLVFSSVAFGIVSGWIWVPWESLVPSAGDLRLTAQLFCVAAMLESLAEPAAVRALVGLDYASKASAEAVGTLCLAVVKALCLAWLHLGVVSFGWGQVVYGLALLGVYGWRLGLQCWQLPSRWSLHSKTLLGLLGSFTLQSIVKHLLTEGDRLLLLAVGTKQQRGVFAAVSNYGSLAVRFLFAPLEDAARGLLSRFLVVGEKRDEIRASETLSLLVRLVFVIGLVCASLGPPLASVVVLVLLGQNWLETGAGTALGSYALFVPILALNGMAEATAQASASASSLAQQSFLLLAFATLSTLIAFYLLPIYDIPGLVFAMAINMLLRAFSALRIANLSNKWTAILQARPSTPSILTALLLSLLLFLTQHLFPIQPLATPNLKTRILQNAPLLATGALATLILAVVLYRFDGPQIRNAWSATKSHKKSQ